MRTTLQIIVIVIVASSIGYFIYQSFNQNETNSNVISSYKDATFIIDGATVQLKDGVSEVPIEHSNTKIVTRVFGNELYTDLNTDGMDDVVFLVTQETGGSGTFFYAVAALQSVHGYIGSDAFYLGDRIAPQSTVQGSGQTVIVTYAERAPTDSFTTPPSIGKSVVLVLDPITMRLSTETR